jgi:hypothetical protein
LILRNDPSSAASDILVGSDRFRLANQYTKPDPKMCSWPVQKMMTPFRKASHANRKIRSTESPAAGARAACLLQAYFRQRHRKTWIKV